MSPLITNKTMFKVDLAFAQPLMNAAGTLGFAPDRHIPVDIDQLGAFVTNPVSLEPRSAARGMRLVPFPGGFLLHTGYPNPGLRTVKRRYAGRWAQLHTPVIVHLLARTPEEVRQMVLELETLDGVMGFELGLPPQADGELAAAMLQAAQGERPVIVRLPYEAAPTLAEGLYAAGSRLISLSPPRGMLPGPGGQMVSGRLYGPCVLPLMLPLVRTLMELGMEVIAGGGIYQPQDLAAYRAAGARLFQLDAVLWRGSIPDGSLVGEN
jgi:dihydroorotate dehydrogenase (NAD+) catalytic subunit